MNTEPILNPCPKCGRAIPDEAPQGLCPRCVLASAATPTETGPKPGERPSPPPLEVVAAAFPQFEIIELIGVGGMGFVFKARQPKLDRFVALKLLPQSLSADPAFAERFHREARFLARLSHPNIVSVFDFGESGGFSYLLLEFVDGVNLRQAMQAGRFSPAEALAIVPSICGALQYAHDHGVLHRDIKPENILLDARGRVKLADFGIAKLVREPGQKPTDVSLTQSGSQLGTPHYMAPEQIERPADVDHRADIYSLGVVFYELLTGELPLGRFAPPSAKADLDARVDAIVFRALAKERELRQQSAGEVKTQVEGLGTRAETAASAVVSPALTASPTPRGPLPDWARRVAYLFLVAGAIGLLPTLFSLNSSMRVFNSGALLALTGIALLTRSEAWRFTALLSNFAGIVLGLVSLSVFLFAAREAPPATYGVVVVGGGNHPGALAVFLGLLQLGGFVAGIWVLCLRSLRPVFGLPTAPRPDALNNLWPWRLYWLLLSIVLLPASAVVAAVLAPMLMSHGFGGLGGIMAGMIPMVTGLALGVGFVRSRPKASDGNAPGVASPWPKRVFWAVLLVIVLPVLALIVALVIPMMLKQPKPSPPTVVAADAAAEPDARLARTERYVAATGARFAWELRARGAGAVRLTLGSQSALIPLQAIGSESYVVTVQAVYRRVSDGGAVRLSVGGGEGRNGVFFVTLPAAKPDDNGVATMSSSALEPFQNGTSYIQRAGEPAYGGILRLDLPGDPRDVIANAAAQAAADLPLKFSTAVPIAFAGSEPVQMEIIPASTNLAASRDGELTRIQLGAGTNSVETVWKLRASVPADVRLTLGSRRVRIPLQPVGQGNYVLMVMAWYQREDVTNAPVGFSIKGVQMENGNHLKNIELPDEPPAVIRAALSGEPSEIFRIARNSVSGDLPLHFNVPVRIANAGAEEVRLELIPGPHIAETPPTSIGRPAAQ